MEGRVPVSPQAKQQLLPEAWAGPTLPLASWVALDQAPRP